MMTKEQALKLDASQVKGSKMALQVAHALGKEWSADELAEYGARRLLALAKDQARKASGAPAEHIYTPDLSKVEDAKTLQRFHAAVTQVAHTYLNPVEDEPVREPAKVRANRAAGKAPYAGMSAKEIRALPPVRKAKTAKAAPSAGGAAIEGF